MIFIVLLHIVVHITGDVMPGANMIKSVTIIGVDLFVMISGYFNIRLSFKSFFVLISVVLFYSVLSWISAYLVFDRPLNLGDIKNIFLPISVYGNYWFVSCYLMLMLLSPAINVFLKNSSIVMYLGVLLVMAYISCVSGWLFNSKINVNGYTTFNMIFMYMLGYCIHRFKFNEKFKSYIWILLYIVFTACIYFMTYIAPGRVFKYNNPIIILSTISLFCFFTSLHFSNKAVNVIASCMFPVYLIQEGFWGVLVYQYLKSNVLLSNPLELKCYGVLFGYAVCLFILALIIEPIRKLIMTKPITLLATFIDEKYNIIRCKLTDKSLK